MRMADYIAFSRQTDPAAVASWRCGLAEIRQGGNAEAIFRQGFTQTMPCDVASAVAPSWRDNCCRLAQRGSCLRRAHLVQFPMAAHGAFGAKPSGHGRSGPSRFNHCFG
jgi:hypothetical protein